MQKRDVILDRPFRKRPRLRDLPALGRRPRPELRTAAMLGIGGCYRSAVARAADASAVRAPTRAHARGMAAAILQLRRNRSPSRQRMLPALLMLPSQLQDPCFRPKQASRLGLVVSRCCRRRREEVAGNLDFVALAWGHAGISLWSDFGHSTTGQPHGRWSIVATRIAPVRYGGDHNFC
jgi:hypothetical protein